MNPPHTWLWLSTITLHLTQLQTLMWCSMSVDDQSLTPTGNDNKEICKPKQYTQDQNCRGDETPSKWSMPTVWSLTSQLVTDWQATVTFVFQLNNLKVGTWNRCLKVVILKSFSWERWGLVLFDAIIRACHVYKVLYWGLWTKILQVCNFLGWRMPLQ